ncbi:hypothetical protein MGYG_02737 [Nannizzia gypsea CBS 118893]|uniref:Protein TED1 n=1 Tax=Arthroderma gypseum (strain ATCC MYA-4604 / CBS 118893) TaxID=535722 RepID=E4UNX0_ARTGP|nr:hypothetical protein MGYG_02737 [Nannizzia gypsea CBS 118893]EFQ99723.1 hypothetical protein MGYG_02737 [Nannizzia gypsea CBS 118893]
MHLCFPALLQRALAVLLPVSLVSLCYLYFYPLFHGCAFPLPTSANGSTGFYPPYTSDAYLNTVRDHFGLHNFSQHNLKPAPFRLLVLADPQLEGDTSLPKPDDAFIPQIKKHWEDVISADSISVRFSAAVEGIRDVVLTDIPRLGKTIRKQLDLLGNDYYLAHIYRTLSWWSRPTHVTVLGDLIGSQWVSDEEFDIRSRRYWSRTFRGGEKVPDDMMATGRDGYTQKTGVSMGQGIVLDIEPDTWSNRIINIAGNHDIGYAGDISQERIDRFEREFGLANWDVRFNLPMTEFSLDLNGTRSKPGLIPSIHLVVLNTLTFDTPALDVSIQGKSYQYLNDVIDRSYPVEDRTTFTLLLTHLPLHKREGICTDPPYFSFHDKDDEHPKDGQVRFKAGGLKEQNHLSDYVSHNGILQGIFGMSGDIDVPYSGKGRNGLILTGHDHTGCDVIHYVDRKTASDNDSADARAERILDTAWSWNAKKYYAEIPTEALESAGSATGVDATPSPTPAIREVTLRSMMGEFGGNAGLLSVWFDADSTQEWKYEITTCQLGVQHVWWAVHITVLVTLIAASTWMTVFLIYGQSSLADERKTPNPKPLKEVAPGKQNKEQDAS